MIGPFRHDVNGAAWPAYVFTSRWVTVLVRIAVSPYRHFSLLDMTPFLHRATGFVVRNISSIPITVVVVPSTS